MHSSSSINDNSINLFDTLTELWILNTFWISFCVFPLPLSFSSLLSISPYFLLWSLMLIFLIFSVTGGQKPGLLKHISGCVYGEYFWRHLAGKPANWWVKAALTGGGTLIDLPVGMEQRREEERSLSLLLESWSRLVCYPLCAGDSFLHLFKTDSPSDSLGIFLDLNP